MKPRHGYFLLIPVAPLSVFLTLWLMGFKMPAGAPTPPPIESVSCLETPSPEMVRFLKSRPADILYRFVYDNVFRQDLVRGYRLTTARERDGMSLREWKTGTIPVVPEPVSLACLVGMKRTKPSEWTTVMKVNGTFNLGVVLKQGRWLVDYFIPLPDTYIPQAY